MTNHEQGFRPSWFPGGQQCVHFESDETKNVEAKQTGTDNHTIISNRLKSAVCNHTGNPQIDWALDLVVEYCSNEWSVVAIEKEVQIVNEDGEVITTGTIDLVLENKDREFIVIDWKRSVRDYTAQIEAYAVAWYDLHPEAKSVRTLVAYLDAQETQGGLLNYALACERTLTLYEKWRNKENEPYHINPYCDWCKLRPDCPAWRASADSALDTVRELAPAGSSALQTARIDLLKNDPVALDTFCIAYERLKTLVEDDWNLKAALKTHIEVNGFKSQNFILVNIDSKDETVKTINPEQFILTAAKYMGAMRAGPAVTVDVEKALAAWKEYTNDPFPCEIKEQIIEHPGYSYIRRKGNHHVKKKK